MAERDALTTMGGEADARAHLAAIVDSSDDAILSRTLEGVVTTWNRGAEKLYGYSAAEAVGRHISFLVPPERLGELAEVDERIGRGELVQHLETVRLTKSGRLIDVTLTLSPIPAEDGSVRGISVIGRDISQRKEMERALRESEKRYRTLVEMAPDAVLVCQEDRFVFANCAALVMLRAPSPEEMAQKNFLDLAYPEEKEAMRARVQELMRGRELPLGEYRLRRLDGEELVAEASATLIEYQGRPAIQFIARDATERRHAEQEREEMLRELQFERSRFLTVARQLPVGVMMADAPSGKVVFHNDAATRILGQEVGEIAGGGDYARWTTRKSDLLPLPPEQCPLARAVRGETVSDEELEVVREDGTRRVLRVNAVPIRSAEGEVVSALAAFSDITESRDAARALADSEERLKLALDAAEMGSCDMCAESGTGLWSARHFTLLGYPDPGENGAAASVAMWLDLVHPDDRPAVRESLEKAKGELGSFRSEHRVSRVDNGQLLWVNVQGRFLWDRSRGAYRFIGVIFDVSERKHAEEGLRESERRFRLMADSMPQIAWVSDADGSAEYVNARFESFTGMARDSQLIRNYPNDPQALIAALVHPEDAAETAQSWLQAVGTGTVFERETRVRRFDGSYHWHLCRAIPVRDEEGRVLKWYGTATDIQDLREAQEMLAASETRFRRLYDSNLLAIFFWNKDGRITAANQAFCDLLGCSVDECREARLNWLEATPPEYLPLDYAALEEAREKGICKTYEKELINRRDGHLVPVLTAVARMEGSEGEGLAFAVDLTELRRTEQALKVSDATLKAAIEATRMGIFDLDLRSGTGIWSDIAKGHYGLPAEAELDLERAISLIHPEDRPRVRNLLLQATTQPVGSQVFSIEYRTIGHEGHKERWITTSARQMADEQGEPARLVGACIDITEIVQSEKALKEEIAERLRTVEELRKQEQLLIRQGRLAAMGEMIGNIAHQWRQPLNTLGLIIQELPRFYQRNLFSREYLEDSVTRAMQVINYMSKTIDGFRQFAGPEKEQQRFRAAEVLIRTVSIVEAAFNELNLKIELDADQEIEIYGSPNEFSQVILNLLVNAKDALVERRVRHPRVEVRLYRENGLLVLTISDNAGGIPDAIMDKIFDPYFTTKAADKGTGIGLFMSKTIIEKSMNGTLSARNTAEGAEFRIEVPA